MSQSPEAHQNFAGSTPELCSGVHQKGCDLEGVRERSHKQLKVMIHPIDFLVRIINPPAQPKDDIDFVIQQIKEVPSPPEREPKEGECDIRNPGAACFADMQEDLEVIAASPELRFPYWDVAETATDTEAVGHPKGLFPLPDFTDQLSNNEAQQNDQADSLTGYSLTNAETTEFDWIQMHHDDGIQDGYLDVIQSDSITGETTNTVNVDGMSGRVTFTGGTGTSQSWYNGQLVTEDISVNPTDNKLAFENNTDFPSEPETLSPVEFDVAAPLLTDQAVVGDQLEAVGSDVCQQLEGVVPKWDLPFGCNQ